MIELHVITVRGRQLVAQVVDGKLVDLPESSHTKNQRESFYDKPVTSKSLQRESQTEKERPSVLPCLVIE